LIDEKSSLDDVAFAVCSALDRSGIEAILTGGSAAAHYAPEAVQSYDADFVLRFGANGRGTDALSSIGYVRTPTRYYKHPRSIFIGEFPPGPLMVGSELIHTWETERRSDEVLYLLTPTDTVRDRFMAYYAWGDVSALASAVLVARAVGKRFDESRFCAWARREAANNAAYDVGRLEIFLSRLHGS